MGHQQSLYKWKTTSANKAQKSHCSFLGEMNVQLTLNMKSRSVLVVHPGLPDQSHLKHERRYAYPGARCAATSDIRPVPPNKHFLFPQNSMMPYTYWPAKLCSKYTSLANACFISAFLLHTVTWAVVVIGDSNASATALAPASNKAMLCVHAS